MRNQIKLQVRDRNLAAFILANGVYCDFLLLGNGQLIAEFAWSPEVEQMRRDYVSNGPVAVQSFVAASKEISDRIRQARQQEVQK